MTPPGSSVGYNFHRDVLKAWTADHPDSNIPRWQFNDVNGASQSDRFITSASYFNIENVNMGYTLPARWVSKVSILSLRIYAACDNVWYWSARKGFDPRGSFSGNPSTASFVPVRTLSLGVNVKF